MDRKDQVYGLGRLVNDDHRRFDAIIKPYMSVGKIFARKIQ